MAIRLFPLKTLEYWGVFSFDCGPGWLSRYRDMLRAGRSRGQILVMASFSAYVNTEPGAHTAFSSMGTGSFGGEWVKRPRRGVKHPPHLAPKLREV
jgi:hypothetical protein